MIAGREVGWDLETGLTDQDAVDLPRFDQVLPLSQVAHLTGLQPKPDLRRVTVHHVHLDMGMIVTLDHHHDRG